MGKKHKSKVKPNHSLQDHKINPDPIEQKGAISFIQLSPQKHNLEGIVGEVLPFLIACGLEDPSFLETAKYILDSLTSYFPQSAIEEIKQTSKLYIAILLNCKSALQYKPVLKFYEEIFEDNIADDLLRQIEPKHKVIRTLIGKLAKDQNVKYVKLEGEEFEPFVLHALPLVRIVNKILKAEPVQYLGDESDILKLLNEIQNVPRKDRDHVQKCYLGVIATFYSNVAQDDDCMQLEAALRYVETDLTTDLYINSKSLAILRKRGEFSKCEEIVNDILKKIGQAEEIAIVNDILEKIGEDKVIYNGASLVAIAEALNGIGFYYNEKCQFQKALDYMLKAVEYDPSNVFNYCNIIIELIDLLPVKDKTAVLSQYIKYWNLDSLKQVLLNVFEQGYQLRKSHDDILLKHYILETLALMQEPLINTERQLTRLLSNFLKKNKLLFYANNHQEELSLDLLREIYDDPYLHTTFKISAKLDALSLLPISDNVMAEIDELEVDYKNLDQCIKFIGICLASSVKMQQHTSFFDKAVKYLKILTSSVIQNYELLAIYKNLSIELSQAAAIRAAFLGYPTDEHLNFLKNREFALNSTFIADLENIISSIQNLNKTKPLVLTPPQSAKITDAQKESIAKTPIHHDVELEQNVPIKDPKEIIKQDQQENLIDDGAQQKTPLTPKEALSDEANFADLDYDLLLSIEKKYYESHRQIKKSQIIGEEVPSWYYNNGRSELKIRSTDTNVCQLNPKDFLYLNPETINYLEQHISKIIAKKFICEFNKCRMTSKHDSSGFFRIYDTYGLKPMGDEHRLIANLKLENHTGTLYVLKAYLNHSRSGTAKSQGIKVELIKDCATLPHQILETSEPLSYDQLLNYYHLIRDNSNDHLAELDFDSINTLGAEEFEEAIGFSI